MKIKHTRDLTWDDLPGIEGPFHAAARIGCRLTGTYTDHIDRVEGLDAVLQEYRFIHGHIAPPEDEREECFWLIEQIDAGDLVIVFGRKYGMDHPIGSVLYWMSLQRVVAESMRRLDSATSRGMTWGGAE